MILHVRNRDKINLINVEEIYYFSKSGPFVTIKTEAKEFVFRGTLNDLSYKLNGKHFLRTHKSYLVNIQRIESISRYNNNSYNITFRNIDDVVYMTRNAYSDYKKTI